MNDPTKSTPKGAPSIFQNLDEQVQRAAAEPKAGGNIRIKMLIEGGVHEERYHFHFVASGEGEVECGMRCQLSDRAYDTRATEMSREEFAEILQKIRVPTLVESSQPDVPIPPCSLVGRLEISNGEQTMSAVFMADAGQAETAGYKMPPALAEIVERIYDLAERQLDAKDVRP